MVFQTIYNSNEDYINKKTSFMNLFENIILDLLLEAKSPEEILSILKYKFKNVPEKVIEAVFNVDPTKKKSFTQWVLIHWDEEKHVIDKFLQNGTFKKMFNYAKEHQEVQLNKYDSIKEAANQLLGAISDSASDDDIDIDLLKKNGNGPENDFTIAFRSGEWIVAIPNTYEADHKLGENTHWCTAGWYYTDEQGRMYYRRYLREFGGCYFINFDLRQYETLHNRNREIEQTTVRYPFTRYQFHFESKQFMDTDDNRVNMSQLNMPNDVIEFYENKGYNFDAVDELSDEERAEQYEAARMNREVIVSDRLSILPEYDQDMNPVIPDNTVYMVYDTERDIMDPVTYTPVSKQTLYVDDVNDFYIFNANTKGHGINGTLLVTDSPADVDEYDGTSDDKPLIIIKIDGNFEVYEDITYYKVIEIFGINTLFFVEGKGYQGSNSNLFLQNSYYTEAIELPFKSVEVGILDIFPNFDVDVKRSDFIFEVVYDNDYHSLFNVSNDGMDYIIKCDKPANNGEHFIEQEDENGDTIILGTLRNYYSNQENYDKNTMTIDSYVKNFYFNNTILVKMIDNNFNIFNIETKQLILPKNFKLIKSSYANIVLAEKYGAVIAHNDDGDTVYSLTTGEPLTDTYPLIDCGVREFYGWVGAQDAVKNYYIFSPDFKQTYGPFVGMEKTGLDTSKILVTVFNQNHQKIKKFFNFKTGKFEFENVGMLSILSTDFHIAAGMTSNGETILFNFETNNIIDKNVMPGQRFKSINKDNMFFGVRHSNTGKMNLINFKTGEKLLPFEVDEIYGQFDSNNYKAFFPFVSLKNNNAFYLFNVDTKQLLPNENGIVTGDTGVYSFNLYGSKMPICSFSIYGNPTYHIVWNYSNGEVSVREGGINSHPVDLKNCTPEVQQRVMQVLNPQKAQFVSQYTEMLKRIKNLIR